MKVYFSDLRNKKVCAKQSRLFFLKHGWDWGDFLKNGIDLEIVKAVDDEMVQQIVRKVEEDGEIKQASDRL